MGRQRLSTFRYCWVVSVNSWAAACNVPSSPVQSAPTPRPFLVGVTGQLACQWQNFSSAIFGIVAAKKRKSAAATLRRNQENIMHLALIPLLGNLVWIGGGSVGAILLIVLVVLLLRR